MLNAASDFLFHFWLQNDMDFSHRSGSRGTNTKSSTGHTVQNSFNKSKVNQTLRRSTSQNDFVHLRDSGSVSTSHLVFSCAVRNYWSLKKPCYSLMQKMDNLLTISTSVKSCTVVGAHHK
jgi:hypothetical protein